MKIGNFKIGWRLGTGFFLVIILAITSGFISINAMEKLAGITTDMYNHPLAVSNAVRDIRTNIIAIHVAMKDVALSNNIDEIRAASALVDQHEKVTFELFDIVLAHFLGDKKTVKDSLNEFAGWRAIRDDVIELMILGERRKAADITRGKGARYVEHLNRDIDSMIDFASQKGASFYKNALDTEKQAINLTMLINGIIFLLSLSVAFIVTRSITLPISEIVSGVKNISRGRFDRSITIDQTDEVGELAASVNHMTDSLRNLTVTNEKQNWLKTGMNGLSEQMRGDLDISVLADSIIRFIAEYIDAKMGALYLLDSSGSFLNLAGSYAFVKRKNLSDRIKIKEGIVGQAAYSKKVISLTNVPEDYTRITSATGDSLPGNVVVAPFLYQGELTGVIELGALREFSDAELEFLNSIMESIAIGFNSARSRTLLKELLENAQEQAIKLQAQQEELQVSNEELEEKTQELQASEEELKSQQEELQVTNEELEEQTLALETQKKEIIEKNKDLLSTQENLEQKAKELEITGKYKSEFLANMSHELRTPLNSLLVLAQYLVSNKDDNLNKEQIESAAIIQSSGEDLLKLIDEILDLSKIEAGRMNINVEKVVLSEVMEGININFKHLTDKSGLNLSTTIEEGLPESIMTDRLRLDQIIRNLTSNAIKFTNEGSIRVIFHRPAPDADLSRRGLDPIKSIAISVIDTGIGIPEDRKSDIFEAFQQIDGSTSRQYGGTGLGLSISRELAKLLGGEIQLTSIEGKGSTFTLYLPEDLPKVQDQKNDTRKSERPRMTRSESAPKSLISPAPSIKDDRDDITENDRVLLVIEDDLNFAEILYKFSHERSFKCLHAGDGETGLDLALEHRPDAVILDMELPGIKGWDVLETLKSSPMTRHIPVHIMSVTDETVDAYKSGAMGYIRKPVSLEQLQQTFTRFEDLISRKIKNLLIVEDNDILRKHIKELVGNGDVKTFEVSNGNDAIEEVKSKTYDCIILDLSLPDISGFDVLKKLDESEGVTIPPVIIYTGRDLTREEEYKLQEYASSIIIKGVRSEERLLDETALFLHRVVDNLPQKKKEIITRLYDVESIFKDRKILLADDDMRNVFAISKVLEAKGMNVYKASDGQKALDILDDEPGIDLVLMDIMMPVIDGYEAIKRIRSQERFKKLPVLAITAKAMKDDYEKCIAAGANDYMSKPVKIEKLLSLMRVWLYK